MELISSPLLLLLLLQAILAVAIQANRYPHGVRLILRRAGTSVVEIGRQPCDLMGVDTIAGYLATYPLSIDWIRGGIAFEQ
jgi:hypothetical protein